MEDQIFTPQETPTLDDVMNTEQEDVVYTPLDNVIDDEIHTLTEPSDVQIPESEEIETGEPIEVTIEDQIITPKKNRIDFQGYELDNISEADNENDVPSIKQVRDIVEEVESEKQDKLTAGDNITITDNVISATDTTYTAGAGLTLTDGEFSVGTITNSMIEDGAVTNDKIGENAVTTSEIADEAITTAKIGDVQVTVDKIASNAVTTAKIANAQVTKDKVDWTTMGGIERVGDITITLGNLNNNEQHVLQFPNGMVYVSLSVNNATMTANTAYDVCTLPNDLVPAGNSLLNACSYVNSYGGAYINKNAKSIKAWVGISISGKELNINGWYKI